MSDDLYLPTSGSKSAGNKGWATGERPGELVRIMVDDPRGYRTMLLQVRPGPFGQAHSHDTIEQIYVLEGDFFDEEATYGPGDFVLRMPGAMHRTGSNNGCTMVLVYAPLAAASTTPR